MTLFISDSLNICLTAQSGDTALMWAIKDGRTEVISQLILAGANINLLNKV